MPEILRTDSSNHHFVELVKKLDAYLAVIDGKEHNFYSQYNKIDKLNNVVLVFENDTAIACGAMKEIEAGVMEVKRMFTEPEFRGRGIATVVLAELEQWAAELGYKKCILETGRRMKDAVALYSVRGYTVIPNYGQYLGIDNSICFEKLL